MKIILKNTILNFAQNNPYSNEWTCTDDSYDCDWDSERGFYAISPQGTGNTKEDALMDYLSQRDDLTEEACATFFNEFKKRN